MRTRTLRGRLAPNENRQLVVDDGRLTNGVRIKSFQAFSVAPTGGSQICPVVLSLNEDVPTDFDASDNRQIGWSISNWDAAGNFSFFQPTVIDHDKVVLQDLYITNLGALDSVNYLIELEPIGLTEDQSILQLIKEVQQNV